MKHWKIGSRISAGFAAVIAITLALGLFAHQSFTSVAQSGSMLATSYLPSFVPLSQTQSAIGRKTGLLIEHIRATDPAQMAELENQMKILTEAVTVSYAAYEKIEPTPEQAALYATVKQGRLAYIAEYNKILSLSHTNTPESKRRAMEELAHSMTPILDSYGASIQDLVNFEIRSSAAGMGAVNASVRSGKTGVLVGLAVAALFAVAIAWFIVRGITRPLSLTVATLQQLAKYDMTATLDIQTRDEMGQIAAALNGAVAALRKTLLEVTATSNSASASSQELSAAAESMASGAQQQAASLEQTSASLEEMTATVRQSADNAYQANQLAQASKDFAERGQEVVLHAVDAMVGINTASAKIADIISTIDEISFQTNLLAVNAAVEAARAGDEGRGFAVVAFEVRSLAQRSAEAAKEIRGLIQDTLKKVERGSELVNRSGETLHEIIGSAKRVTDIVGEISAAAGEHTVGMEQVSTAVIQIDRVTQSNSSHTEELAATATSLSDQARRLTRLVGVFKLADQSLEDEYAALPVATASHASAPPKPKTMARKPSFSALAAGARRRPVQV